MAERVAKMAQPSLALLDRPLRGVDCRALSEKAPLEQAASKAEARAVLVRLLVRACMERSRKAA